ncbi:MAG: hypothetical protein KKG00_06115 [Bacteroidetes bacterium]|nr:hypothetical protein [Bacteroidota bacterium]
MSTPISLTDEQIDALYAFVKSKYVDYYDVQLELVDHLASEVEQKMAANPAVSFDIALQQVYSGFGIFGFTEVVELKAAAVIKATRLLWWKSFKALFRLPYILGSLVLGMILFISFRELETRIFIIANGIALLSAYLIAIVFFFRRGPSKHFKLTAFQYNTFVYLGAAINLYQLYSMLLRRIIEPMEPSSPWLLATPLFIWLVWLIMGAGFTAYNTVLKKQQKLYPQAFA